MILISTFQQHPNYLRSPTENVVCINRQKRPKSLSKSEIRENVGEI